MFQVAVGVGTDELAPEMFIGVDFGVDYGGGGGHGGSDRRFRLDGQCGSALVAEFRAFPWFCWWHRAQDFIRQRVTQ